jgi:2-polyprenyl-6-methoxyphenol hydroxylase-like FAD-dependent oxidoreductase
VLDSREIEAPVLIVGAGPTGLLLAAELRRRGVRCRLIDEHTGPMHWDRATVIHPRSLEVFGAIGLLDRFLEAGVKQRKARIHSHGRRLGEIDLATCGSRHGFNIGLSEETTESILAEYLARNGGHVERSCRLAALQLHADGVVATIEGSGTEERAPFQWLIGCDGVHSVCREQSGIELEGSDINAPWAVFDATLDPWSESYEANYVYLDELPVILTALPDRRWRVYLRPSSADSDLAGDAAATIRRYHPEAAIVDVSNPTRFHCHTKVASRFRSGRVLLAGDAAHVCSPAEGHGMNSGIQDAFNLAWKLALVVHRRCPPDVLQSYELERRPVAEQITRSGAVAERGQTLTTSAARRARDSELVAAYADPTSRHHEVVAEAELDIDYGGSPIAVGDANTALGPGQRLPTTIRIDGPDGRQRFLDQALGRTGHTALLVGGTGATATEVARLAALVGASVDPTLVEVTVSAFASNPDRRCTRLDASGVRLLDVEGVTLFVIRPDGHVGLRADRDHVSALNRYQSLLRGSP